RHQRSHKRGAYACVAPGCKCTFLNPALLERHKRHESCFAFELPEIYLFRCPSRPELSRSASATPVTPSDDGNVSNSPTAAHVDFASSPEDTFSPTSLSPPSQYLQVPGRNDFINRHGGGHSHRPMARSGTSSPAIMQSTHNDSTPSFLSGFSNPALECPSHYTFHDYVAAIGSATELDPWAENSHTTQEHQPMLHHAVSLDDINSISNIPQTQLFPPFSSQHVEPRYSGPMPSEIDAHTYFHASPSMATEHNHNALWSYGVLDQSLQGYSSAPEGVRQPTMMPLDQDQLQTSSAGYPSSPEAAHSQPPYLVTRNNASRSHSTGNINLQHFSSWSDEQR
ncbi:unnamed protein product, partial [Aureobasidium mustum]